MIRKLNRVLVTGGAGYVGSVLVPKLLSAGYQVRVLDLFWFGEDVLSEVQGHPALQIRKGDLRERWVVEEALTDCDAVIHLACVSNDPSFELNPEIGRAINYEAFIQLVEIAKDCGVNRFIYASSSSVYGIKSEPEVTEDLPLEPLTDYSKYKAMCEEVLLREAGEEFITLILRPATVCGYSPRMRLDLTVNILTNHAVHNRLIKVFGGNQMRPNIHIDDMTDLYVRTLKWRNDEIAGKIYNVGYDNFTIRDIAEKVKTLVGDDVEIVTTPTDDNRSYHISSKKIKQELKFTPRRSIEYAIRDLMIAFTTGKIPDAMTDSRYYNIKRMQEINVGVEGSPTATK